MNDLLRKHEDLDRNQKEVYKEIIKNFQHFLKQFDGMQLPKELNMLLYSILKTEADLLVDLQQYDLGIKAYKTLKDFCDDDKWGMLDLKMMCSIKN